MNKQEFSDFIYYNLIVIYNYRFGYLIVPSKFDVCTKVLHGCCW